MKILHCANYDLNKYGKNYYSHDFRIHNGLVRNEFCVYPFSYRDEARKNIFSSKRFGIRRVNEKLIESVKNIKPDILLLGHTELIVTATLSYIKETYKIPVAMWWVDSFDDEKVTHLYDRFELLDALFTTTAPYYVQKRFNLTHTPVFYMPNMSDASMDVLKNFSQERLHLELLYVGKMYKEKLQFFSNLTESRIPIKIFNGIFGAQYFDLLSQFAFGMNVSKYNDIPLYTSDRIIHLVANGLLTFSPKIPQFEEVFSEDEVLYFESIEELWELYHKAKKDRKWAKKIAYKGWQRSHEEYNSTKVTKWMMETVLEVKK